MMKKTILFALGILLGQICFAQSSGGKIAISKKTRNNLLFFGPKVGVGMTSFSGQPSECDLFDGGSIGFEAGVALNARWGKATASSPQGTGMLGAAVELNYRQAMAKTIADDDLSLGYLEVPVLFKCYPAATRKALNGLYIEAGPEFAMLMSKSPDVMTVQNNSLSAAYQSLAYHTGDLKGGDLRMVVGVGYTVPNTGLGFNARYHIGTSELSENALPVKMCVLDLSIAWMFKLGAF
ncbi:MAG: PorT family protein [Prevotella sp.]|nr:PorT family protein [Prevotella sp.]